MRTRSRPFLILISSLVATAALTNRTFYGPKDYGLNIHWTPYTAAPLDVPEVLADPVIAYVIGSDRMRLYLLDQFEHHGGVIGDFKALTDATPKYTRAHGPEFPFPKDTALATLSPEQAVDYILRNYDLPPPNSPYQARFSAQEKVAHHPLIQALQKDRLVMPGAPPLDLVEGALAKIHRMWEGLLRLSPVQERGTLLPLPNKYVVAGGRFRESYYWDSYWIIKGLLESGYGTTARGMVENFVVQYEKYGIIPNGGRFYYLTRTQPPLFMAMVQLLRDRGLLTFHAKLRASSLEARVLHVGIDYYQRIWKGSERYQPEFGLFRYWDGAGGGGNDGHVVVRPEASLKEPRSEELLAKRVFAESGWDMSYSRFGHRPQDFLPVDLNAILIAYTATLAKLLRESGDETQAAAFEAESGARSKAFARLRNPDNGIYVDYNFATKARSSVFTAASYFAFRFALPASAENQRALRQLDQVLKPEGDLGIHTTDRRGEGQWDGAWTWPPLEETAVQAYLKNGLDAEAEKAAFDYCLMVLATAYKHKLTFFEKNGARDGALDLPKGSQIYGNEVGFGWTNGTLAVLLRYLRERGLIPKLESALADRLKSEHR